jgi:hypothetical protein
MEEVLAIKKEKLENLARKLIDVDSCVEDVIGGGFSELFNLLYSYEAKDGTNSYYIDNSLDLLCKISSNCFFETVPKENQRLCIEGLK